MLFLLSALSVAHAETWTDGHTTITLEDGEVLAVVTPHTSVAFTAGNGTDILGFSAGTGTDILEYTAGASTDILEFTSGTGTDILELRDLTIDLGEGTLTVAFRSSPLTLAVDTADFVAVDDDVVWLRGTATAVREGSGPVVQAVGLGFDLSAAPWSGWLPEPEDEVLIAFSGELTAE